MYSVIFCWLCFFGTSSAAISKTVKFRSDYIYKEETESFYKFHKEPSTWFKARETCGAENASLIVIGNLYEAELVRNMMIASHTGEAFVGLQDHFTEGKFVTEQGVSVNAFYDEWGLGQPNDPKEQCLVFLTSDKLHDYNCDRTFAFFCEKRLTEFDINRCNHRYLGYTYNKKIGKCYKMHAKPLDWIGAYEVCKSEESHLAILNDKAEASFLVELVKTIPLDKVKEKYDKNKVLLGFHNLFQSGFETVSGDPLTTLNYNEWSNSNITEKCGAMTYDGKLSDISCDTHAFYVCAHDE